MTAAATAPALRADPPPPGAPCGLFFIVGNGRSGTTLLATLLDRHSMVAIPGESLYFIRLHDIVRLPLRLRGGLHRHDLLLNRRHFRSAGTEPVFDRAALEAEFRAGPATEYRLFSLLMAAYAASRGKPVAGEKSPGHLDHMDHVLPAMPQARAICMMRDGRDSVASFVKAEFSHSCDTLHAETWRRAARTTARLLERFPDRTLLVRYEDLLLDPQAELSRVCRFLGLEFEPRQLDPTVGANVTEAFEASWKAKAAEAIDPSRAHAWKRTMPAPLAERLTVQMQPELERFGYDTAPARGASGMARAEYALRRRLAQLFIRPAIAARTWSIRAVYMARKLSGRGKRAT